MHGDRASLRAPRRSERTAPPEGGPRRLDPRADHAPSVRRPPVPRRRRCRASLALSARLTAPRLGSPARRLLPGCAERPDRLTERNLGLTLRAWCEGKAVICQLAASASAYFFVAV